MSYDPLAPTPIPAGMPDRGATEVRLIFADWLLPNGERQTLNFTVATGLTPDEVALIAYRECGPHIPTGSVLSRLYVKGDGDTTHTFFGQDEQRTYVVRYELPSEMGSDEPAQGALAITAPKNPKPGEVFEAARLALATIPKTTRMTKIFYRSNGDETVTVWSGNP